jgi:hypothetical protein
MKLVANVGSESHTSSRAWARLEDTAGKQIPARLQPDPDAHTVNARWFLAEADLPNGAIFRYKCGGADGARGVNRYAHDKRYRMDESVEVREVQIDCGPHVAWIKGRFTDIVDVTISREIDTREGF